MNVFFPWGRPLSNIVNVFGHYLGCCGWAIALICLASQPSQGAWNFNTLVMVSDGLDAFWGSYLGRRGIQFRYPVVYPHRGTVPTPCGPSSLAHYCPQDNTIHLNIPVLTRLANRVGDAAAYYAVAHEYGHSVQNHLGLLQGNRPLVTVELQADCLAGVFFAATEKVGILETGDLQEGIFTANLTGDYDYHDPQHHGTPKQRARAFLSGFRAPHSCF